MMTRGTTTPTQEFNFTEKSQRHGEVTEGALNSMPSFCSKEMSTGSLRQVRLCLSWLRQVGLRVQLPLVISFGWQQEAGQAASVGSTL